MRFPMCLVKLVKIWLNFIHICIHVKYGIVHLLKYCITMLVVGGSPPVAYGEVHHVPDQWVCHW
jgi:hypothetical protein